MPNTSTVKILASDADFERACTMLTAGGFSVTRALPVKKDKLKIAAGDITRRFVLTERESEVLGHMLAGKSNQEIATEIDISRATVKWHSHNIFAKTNTGSREALLRLALQL